MNIFKITLIGILLLSFNASIQAQLTYDKWETVELEDEFGDKTGESVKRIFHEGSFSNSAAYNKDLIVKVVDYGDNMLISLFEYSRPPGAKLAYDNTFGTISVKMNDNKVKKFKVFAPDSGGIYINNEDDLFKLLKSGGSQKLKVSVRQSSFTDVGQSSYNFNLLTQ